MADFFHTNPLKDRFLSQSEVVMEGTSLLSLPEGMLIEQIQITENRSGDQGHRHSSL